MEECPLTVKNEIEKEGLTYPNCKTMSNGIKTKKRCLSGLLLFLGVIKSPDGVYRSQNGENDIDNRGRSQETDSEPYHESGEWLLLFLFFLDRGDMFSQIHSVLP